MNTDFTFLDRHYSLTRYPEHLQHPSWQAWDSADELVLEHFYQQSPTDDQRILIFNDDFGALSCVLSSHHIYHISDSYIAQVSCEKNRLQNGLDTSPIEYLSSLSPLPKEPNWVIIKLPKTLALLEQQLLDLQPVVTANTKVVACGKAKAIHKSTLSLFERLIGPTHTSLARKKSRLIFSQPKAGIKPSSSPYPTRWQTEDGSLTLLNHANVFSRAQLDIGARLLLEHLPDCSGKRVIDLGCGNGILGLTVLQRYPDSRVTFVDESHMAVTSARENVQANFPHLIEQCDFIVSNCLEALDSSTTVDVVLCNPPFHQQNTVTDHIALQMFSDAKRQLSRGGELRIIGNRHLDYPLKLKGLFGGYKVIGSNAKFSILSCIK